MRKFVAPEIVFGVGALDLAGQYGRSLGGSKALVVSDPGVVAAGWVQQVLPGVEAAGLESTLFTQVTSLIDPATLITMDALLTACTGMDSLEAYVSVGHSPRPKMLLNSAVDDDRSVVGAFVSLVRYVGYTAAGFVSGEDFLTSHQLGFEACLMLGGPVPVSFFIYLQDSPTPDPLHDCAPKLGCISRLLLPLKSAVS